MRAPLAPNRQFVQSNSHNRNQGGEIQNGRRDRDRERESERLVLAPWLYRSLRSHARRYPAVIWNSHVQKKVSNSDCHLKLTLISCVLELSRRTAAAGRPARRRGRACGASVSKLARNRTGLQVALNYKLVEIGARTRPWGPPWRGSPWRVRCGPPWRGRPRRGGPLGGHGTP